jgi:cytochrome c5
MRTKIQLLLALSASIVSSAALAQSSTPTNPTNTHAKSPAKAQSTTPQDVGERKFNANCSRCHSAPEQLSPTITGTVVRHMSVRANLSAQDEKDILKFLAP